MSKVAQPGPAPDRGQPVAPPEQPASRSWLWPLLMGAALLAALLLGGGTSAGTGLDYTSFLTRVTAGDVRDVTLYSDGSVTGTLKDGKDFHTDVPTGVGDTGLLPLLQERGVVVHAKRSSGSGSSFFFALLPWLVFAGLMLWFARRAGRTLTGPGGIAGFGRSRTHVVGPETPGTTFADVAGYDEVKREVAEVVDFLRSPERYSSVGALMPKGILLVGPPGTGKTLLARAVAGEAGVPFLSVTGSSFMEMFVGVGASRVRDLFEEARKRAPAIIFIDEIDAVGSRRGAGPIAHEEHGQTLDQLLAEMDGFDPTVGVVLLAATNRPDVLDPALLRPGRFDRQIVVPLPDRGERLAILQVHSRGKSLDAGVDLDVVARSTPGFSGADLANLVNEAAINAVRHDRKVLARQDFTDARDRVLLGLRKTANALLPSERRAVAVHEAGHAVVAALSAHGDPVAKVTILPTGQALGVTEQLPVDERHLYAESYLLDSLAIRMGGRAAEVLVLGEGSTGASNDLTSATEIATRMVREFGMSAELGPVGYGSDDVSYLGLQTPVSRPYAEATQRIVDQEVSALLVAAEARARDVLAEHRPALDKLADLLVEQETVEGPAVYELLGLPTRGEDAERTAS